MKLRIIPTSEGYFDVITKQYIYNYTDHLGNVRLSYSDTNKDGIIQPRQYQSLICNISPAGNVCYQGWKPGEIVEVNNYYPFGLMHNYTATTQNAYQYKYNGKELQETGMYDYGARFYMPDLGRWGVTDPLAEVSRRFTPYNYGNNNPIRFIDPDGRLTMDNLSTYSRGSAVADFNRRNGFGEENLPLFYSDDAGMMIVNEALGENGQGGGSSRVTLGDLIDNYLANSSTNYFEGIDFIQFGFYDWRNKNGELIYDPKANKGKGEFTKYASKDDKKIAAWMLKTTEGSTQFDKLINSIIPTTISLLSGEGPSAGTSQFTMGNTQLSRNSAGKVLRADIEIYEGRIDAYKKLLKSYYTAGKQHMLNTVQQSYHKANRNGGISANIGHELGHAVDPANYLLYGPPSEVKPDLIEQTILSQWKN